MGWSVIWSPKNGQLLKGPSNYFLYAVNLGKAYLSIREWRCLSNTRNDIQGFVWCIGVRQKMNPKLVYMTTYIQFMITEAQKYDQYSAYSLGWRAIEDEILNISVDQYKNQQLYIEAIKRRP